MLITSADLSSGTAWLGSETTADPTAAPAVRLALAGTPALAVFSTSLAGDLRPGAPGSAVRRARVLPGQWAWTRQVHGADVVVLGTGSDGRLVAGTGRSPVADGLVSPVPAPPLAMFAADCALVALASPEGVIGIAHCGWRGLLAGVVQAVAARMRELGASELSAVRGPCIGPECYAFGSGELDHLARRYGAQLRSRTSAGTPALDLRAGVAAAAGEAGVARLTELDECTACSPRWFSYRARHDDARHALVVSRGPDGGSVMEAP